jgi:CelD/BcsL family acetyltransferase involved in cellulose biosynthesis
MASNAMISVYLRQIDESRWRSFTESAPDALLFHTWDWLDFLRQVYGTSWHPLGVFDEPGQMIGLFPLLTRRLGPFVLAGSPLMQAIASTPFMGPLTPASHLGATLVALDHWMRRTEASHVEVAFPTLIEEASFHRLNYHLERCQAVALSLDGRDEAELWGGLSSACRRSVRKAERSGVVVMEGDAERHLADYYDMCQEVYQGAGRLPHLTLQFYDALFQRFAPTGNLKMLLAFHGQEVIAGAIFLLHRTTAYYLSGASYNHRQDLRPNNLIQWRFLQWAQTAGYRWYDLGGAVVPGITHFKLSFGGHLFDYTRIYRANSAAAHLGRACYQRALPLWRRLQAQLSTRRQGRVGG